MQWKFLSLIGLSIGLLFFACKGVQQYTYKAAQRYTVPSPRQISKGACADAIHYAPSLKYPAHTPQRTIQVLFHFFQNDKHLNNLTEGFVDTFTQSLVNTANYKLNVNPPMNLPVGNSTPRLPVPWRYVRSSCDSLPKGYVIHRLENDEHAHFIERGPKRNFFKHDYFERFAACEDDILNVFVYFHHADSVRRVGYKNSIHGLGMPTYVKLVIPGGDYMAFRNKKDRKRMMQQDLGMHAGNLNHEVGHTFGLSHTWNSNDGCDDTPKHPNCWGPNVPPCTGVTSNNVMDYNSTQDSWTPCQIGKVMHTMSKQNKVQRGFLLDDWCNYHPEATITIKDSVVWKDAKDLKGDIQIQDGGHLTIQCRVHLPKGAQVFIAPTGTLTLDGGMLYNNCDDTWDGIQIEQMGRDSGRVQMINGGKLFQLPKNHIQAIQ